MNFFATLNTLSCRYFEFASVNLFGPALRTSQQTNAQTCAVPFIECSHTVIESFVKIKPKVYIEKIHTHLGIDVIPLSIYIDGNNLSKNILLLSAHKCNVGYASPNHAI